MVNIEGNEMNYYCVFLYEVLKFDVFFVLNKIFLNGLVLKYFVIEKLYNNLCVFIVYFYILFCKMYIKFLFS